MFFEAVVRAAETADACAKAVTEAALANGYTTIIIADHGNAEFMVNADGTPNTAHTTNLVPCILVDKNYHPALNDGKLADIAPTILQLMGIPQPAVMGGVSLIKRIMKKQESRPEMFPVGFLVRIIRPYISNKIRVGSSSICFTRTKKLTDSLPSMIRWS